MMLRNWLTVVAAATTLASVAAAQGSRGTRPDPWDVLEEKVKAEGTVRFSGVREVQTFRNGNAMLLRQTVQRETGDRYRIETISPPAHKGVLVVSDGVHRWRYDPRSRIAIQEQLPLRAEAEAQRLRRMRELRNQLLLTLADGGHVASRPTWLLTVTGRDTNALLRRYWIDQKTSVELKKELLTAGGAPTQREWFISIDYAPAFVGNEFAWQPPPNVIVRRLTQPLEELPLEHARTRVDFDIFNPPPTSLPPGYQLIADEVAVFEEDEVWIAWLRFSNGLDIFSLFERRAPAFPVRTRHDALTSEWVAGQLYFTLVGQLRPQYANSLQSVTVQMLGSPGRVRPGPR